MLGSNPKGQRCCWHLLFIVYSLFSIALIGCVNAKEYRRVKPKVSTVCLDDLNLEGMSKNDVIKKLGQPLAASQSKVSESWYYAKPFEIWIWFNGNNIVSRWEAK